MLRGLINGLLFLAWTGLSGVQGIGCVQGSKSYRCHKRLRNKGIFRSRLHEISSYRLKSPVPLTQLVSILIQLERLQKSGFPL